MAVSYANELSLAVITTGTEAGTWGTLTNDNFQYALTQAIGGKATVTFTTTTTTLTPTSTNGLQDFRALFLTCSGSPGAASTLVVPAINKPYLIKNSLTGGYDLTVKIGSSTGTVVPNGKTMFLYANGSDVISTNDYFATLSSGGAFTVGTSASPASTTLNGSLTVGTTTTGTTYSTYTKTSTKVTVNGTGFGGFAASDVVYIDFSGGDAPDGLYSVDASPTPTATAFTATPLFTPFPTGTTGGNVTSITKYNNSSTLNTSIVLPTVFGAAGTLGQYLISQGAGAPPRWESLTGVSGAWTVGGTFTANGDSTIGSVSNGTTYTTYTKTTTTITVNGTGFPFANTDVVYVVLSGGDAPNGLYTVSSASSTQFVGTPVFGSFPTGTTGGSVTSVTKYNNTATLQAPLDTFGSVGTSGYLLASQGTGAPPQWVNGVSSLTNSTAKLSVDSSGNFTSVIPSGSTLLPTFLPRAWVNFDGATAANVSGTYSQSGTTVTVTITGHNLIAGNVIYSDITSGTGVDGTYTVATVTDANTFTYTAGTSLTTSGNITLTRRQIMGSGNVGTIAYAATGTFYVNFSIAMPDSNYCAVATGARGGTATATTTGTFTPQSYLIRLEKADGVDLNLQVSSMVIR